MPYLTALQLKNESSSMDRDLFDVSTKEYSRKFGMSKSSAQRQFKRWHEEEKWFIKRIGAGGINYPNGRTYRMSRMHFITITQTVSVVKND